MSLDAVLASPDLDWLTTEREKVAYVAAQTAPAPENHEETMDGGSSKRAGMFSTTFPIGIDPSGRAVLLYLATVPWADEFRLFLQGHAACLKVAPCWTLRLVFPRPLDRLYATYQTVIHEELETPLHAATINELRWYFTHRQTAIRDQTNELTRSLLDRAASVFGAPRFTLLYRRWQKHGDAAFEGVSSPVIAEALATGMGRVECLVLSHTYRHLSPFADLVRSAPQAVEKGEQEGEQGSARPQPPPSTPSQESPTISEQLTRDWYRLIGRS